MDLRRTVEKFDYQLDRHCSKTHDLGEVVHGVFDYQLDRHCSKTVRGVRGADFRLITS